MTQMLTEPQAPAPTSPPTTTPRLPTDFERLLDRDFVSPAMLENAAEMRRFDQMIREAKVWADSDLVPAHYRGKVPNCYIALQVSKQLKVNVLQVMQQSYVIQGKLAFQAVFMIALVNASGLFDGGIDYEYHTEGDDPDDCNDLTFKVRCVATRKGKSRKVCGPWVTWQMVQAEGWDQKGGSKWKTMPGPMFDYRAAAFFVRTRCPEVIMGFQTLEEMEDVGELPNDPMPPKNGNGHTNGNGKRSRLADYDNGGADVPTAGSGADANPATPPHNKAGNAHGNHPAAVCTDEQPSPAQTPSSSPEDAPAEAAPHTASAPFNPTGSPTAPAGPSGAVGSGVRPKGLSACPRCGGVAVKGLCHNCGPAPTAAEVAERESLLSYLKKQVDMRPKLMNTLKDEHKIKGTLSTATTEQLRQIEAEVQATILREQGGGTV